MTDETPSTAESTLRERLGDFLRSEFPQIAMHGGYSEITEIDPENGTATIVLTGECSGCGLHPMTAKAIKGKASQQIPGITSVEVKQGPIQSDNSPSSDQDYGAPF